MDKGYDLHCEPKHLFAEIENEHLSQIVQQHNVGYKSINFGENYIREMLFCSMYGAPISTNVSKFGYQLSLERIKRIAEDLPTFQHLSMSDQKVLLHANEDKIVSLRASIFFDASKKGYEQILLAMGIGKFIQYKS